jgi:tetratricopeptide (TPR) repeat protein
MKIKMSLVALCILSGCADFSRHEVKGLSLDPAQKTVQLEELAKADKQYESAEYSMAQELYKAFKEKNPYSPFFQRAQLGEAQSLEKLGEWSQAAALFREMIEATRVTQPEIAAEALYQSSYCYEALGDEGRVFAVLEDALRMKDSLRPEVALAEIPARMAASYNRTGRFAEARKSLLEAEAGIQRLRATQGDRLQDSYLAKIYSQMGKLSTNQLATENFLSNLETLKSVQGFSQRSIELGNAVYSKQALESLKGNYRDFYLLIQQVGYNKALDIGAAKREQIERKSVMASSLLASIEMLKQSQKNLTGEGNLFSTQLFDYLSEIENKLITFLNTRGELNELTPEAMKLRSVKKNILIQSEPLFPNERK